MGFFPTKNNKKADGPTNDVLHKLECKVCPLNKIATNKHPHMEPTGAKKPLVYVLGEAPGREEDFGNEQFIGASGQLLRARIPDYLLPKVRFNNCVRTRPWKNQTPGPIEIECCRPSVERDIAKTKPKAIFGFGNIPLHWVSKFHGITEWRGRRMPVNIAGHSCWYYSFAHPSFLLRNRPAWAKDRGLDVIGSELERAFKFDMDRAIEELDHLPEPVVHTREMAEEGIEVYSGNKPDDFVNLCNRLREAAKQKDSGLDFETKGWRPYGAESKILTAAISTRRASFAFALGHREIGFSVHQLTTIWELFVNYLASPGKKYVHNLAYEMEWIGVDIDPWLLRASPFDCTMMQASTLDERKGERGDKKRGRPEKGPLSLEFLCRQYFGFSVKGLSNVNVKDLDNEPLDATLKYNAIDAKYHRLLGRAQAAELRKQGLTKVYRRGLRRIPTCVLTQIQGIPCNVEVTHRLQRKYERQMKKISARIQSTKEVAKFKKLTKKQTFNEGSYPDLVVLLRDVLKSKKGWVLRKHTGEKRYSTDEDVLTAIGLPITDDILKLRKVKHKHSTYLYDRHVWPDGLLHPVLNPGFFTDTFRLSSDNPNEQQIPKRDEGDQEIRLQIEAPLGHTIVAIDLGQIEARVIAMATKDPIYVQSFWDRIDIHMKWAKRVAKIYPDRIGGRVLLKDTKVMKTFRTDIKNQWTFPLFFGANLESVSGYLDIPPEDLEPEYKLFQHEYASVFEWQKTLVDFYQKNGYVESLLGRRRRAPMSKNELINAPIQCSMCELVMDAMNRLSERAQEQEDWYFQPRINIHDDLTFILPDKKLRYYIREIVLEMLAVDRFKFVNVPITLEVSVGKTLYPYHPEKYPQGMQEIFRASSDKPKKYDWNEKCEDWKAKLEVTQ